MEKQYLREILGKPEHPQPMTIKDLMQLLYHAIRVLKKTQNNVKSLIISIINHIFAIKTNS